MFNSNLIHPIVVHFPIALIIVGFFTDVLYLFIKKEYSLSRTGLYLMVLGALSAVVAWTTGEFFTVHPSGGEILKVFQKHETAAFITMLIMVTGAALRIYLAVTKKEGSRLKWIVLGLYLLAFSSVGFTGMMGGEMVYNFMLGI